MTGIIILLSVIVCVMAVGFALVHSAIGDLTYKTVENYEKNFLAEFFQNETERLAGNYAETFEACQKLTDLLKKGEFNLDKIREETESRAYALLISNAEHSVNICAARLADIDEHTKRCQEELDKAISFGNHSSSIKRQLREFAEQRKFCEKDLEGANRRLDNLLYPEIAKGELNIPECLQDHPF